ncbi:MAG TPA: hypothetical protein DCR93_25425 [Cytophagales bacterium]|nr:hypothetical protein [Cytophagales bacterium]HAP62696.1 hypothetical protein [Cytophagales bacterium]
MDQRFAGLEEIVNSSQVTYHASHIRLNYIQVPLLVGFEGSGWPTRLRMKGGAAFMLPLQTEFTHVSDIDYGDVIVQGSPSTPFPFRDFFMGVQAGVAYRYQVGGFVAETEFLFTRSLD